MKIIAIKWRHGSSEFVHAVVNGDGRAEYAQLKKADSRGLFDISVFEPDTYKDTLEFVKTENSDKGVTA